MGVHIHILFDPKNPHYTEDWILGVMLILKGQFSKFFILQSYHHRHKNKESPRKPYFKTTAWVHKAKKIISNKE